MFGQAHIDSTTRVEIGQERSMNGPIAWGQDNILSPYNSLSMIPFLDHEDGIVVRSSAGEGS